MENNIRDVDGLPQSRRRGYSTLSSGGSAEVGTNKNLSTPAVPVSGVPVQKDEEEDTMFDVHRIVLLDLVVHPLDFFSAKHMTPSKSTDVRLKKLFVSRKELLGPPTSKGGGIDAKSWKYVANKFAEKMMREAMAHNKTRILKMFLKSKPMGMSSLTNAFGKLFGTGTSGGREG